MADLDDFFAKKDRKKSKAKKLATFEEVVKNLDDVSKIKGTTKKETFEEEDDGTTPNNEQDEWKDFEEEKKDYSGLKIGNLTLNAGDGNSGNSENYPDLVDGEGGGNEGEKRFRSWKVIENESQEGEVEKNVEPSPPVAASAASTPSVGVYKPPSLRNQPQQRLRTFQHSKLKLKDAPDIHNEASFPSLSTSKSDQRKARNEDTFEVVAHNRSSSLRHAEQTQTTSMQGPKLNLGNRYNMLSKDS